MPSAAADHVYDAVEYFVSGFRGFFRVFQVFPYAFRGLYSVFLECFPRPFQRGRVRGGEAAGNGRRLVTDHVGEQQGDGGGGVDQLRQAAAFEDRDVLSYAVDLLYIRPAFEKIGGQLLQVFYFYRWRRVRQKRRRPAADEGQQQVTFSKRFGELAGFVRRLHAAFVGFGGVRRRRFPGSPGLRRGHLW